MKHFYILLLIISNFCNAYTISETLPPSATIAGGTTVCQNATSPIITFTGSGGTAPYTFTYKINGGPNLVTAQSIGNSITVSAPTGTVGVFIYSLVNVIENSGTPLTVIGTATITVSPPPTVDFAFTNDNTCFPVQFNAIVGSGNYAYSWNFNDSSPNVTLMNPQHLFISVGNGGTQIFNVELTITNTVTNCSNSIIKQVTVKRRPDSSLNTTTTDGATFYDTVQNIFLNCSATVSFPNFDFVAVNTSTTISTNTSYTIDWGDLSPNTTTNNFTFLQHTYTSLGFFNISITTFNSLTGCSSTKIYRFFNGNSPAGNLDLLGNADDCAPYSFTWPVQNTSANPPGTTYEFSVNDGSLPQIFTQANIPTSITHNFTQSSCVLPGNKFTVTFKITNPCNENSPTTQVQVAQEPVASFDINPGLTICANNVVTFTNTSLGNYISGTSCLTNFTKTWTITPNTGWSLTAGSLNGTDIINVIFNTPGNYNITLNIRKPGSSIARCTDDTITRTICVEPPITPSFTFVSNPNTNCAPLSVTTTNTTVPINQCSPPVYSWSVSYAAANCGTAPAYTYTGGTSATSVSPSFNFTEAGIYTITLTATNSCTPPQVTFQTITVKKPPTVTLNNIPDFCQSVTLTAAANIGACTNTTPTYLWSFPGGTPSSATSQIAPSVSYTTAGNHTITLAVTNECGTTTATSNTFNVLSAPTVQNETVTVCSGIAFSITPSTATTGNIIPAGTTYTWNAPVVTGGMTGGLAGTNQTSISGTLINPTSLAQTATYTVTPKSGNCIGATFTVIVTVNPSPVVTFSPTPQNICSGSTSVIVTLTSTTSGATYSWTATQPAGVTGVVTSGTNTIPAQTLTNTTNAPITITYNGTATTAGSSICLGALYPYTIIVKPNPSITESFTSTVCSGSSFTITPSNSALNNIPTGTTYSWSVPIVTGGMAGGAVGNNQTAITGTLNNPTDIVQTATYTITPITNGCPGAPFTVTVTVNPKPTIANVIPLAICSGTSFAVTPTNGSGNIVPTGTTYTWIVSANANISGHSASNASGVTTMGQTLTNSSNINQTITYTVTPTSGSCPGTSFTITVTVNPKPTIANVTPPAICSGDAFTVTPSNGNGNIISTGTTYTWGNPISNPIGAIIGGSAQATGQIGISQTLTNTTNDVATLTYTVTPVSGNCTGNTFTITVTVNPIPTALALINQIYCNGVTTSVITFSNSVVGTTYSWSNSNTSIGLVANGIGNIPVFTPTNTTNGSIVATISVIATANGCSRPAEVFTITINPAPTVTFSPTQSLCSGDTSAVVTLNSTIAGATFTWIATPPAGITGVVTSGTDTIPAQTLINSTNAPITITYNASATTASGSSCAGAVYPYTITVKPNPSITESFTDITCSGDGFTVTPSNSTLNIIPTGTTYSWGVPIVTGSMTGGAAGIAQSTITDILNNPTDIIQTATYSITPTTNGCTGNPFSIIITVNPKPLIIDVIPPEICSEGTFTVTPSNGSGNIVPTGTTYTWTVSVNANITGQSASSGAGVITISQTLTNISNINQIITYTVTPTSGSCPGIPFTITVTVNPKPTIANVTPPAICSGDAFTVTPSNGNGNIISTGTTYTWGNPISNPIGAIIGGSAQATGQIGISQTLTNTTNDIATLTYTVTPVSGSCAGNPFTITVTLSPIPVVLPQTAIICSTTAFSTSPTNTGGNIVPLGTTYTWTNPTINPVGSITGASAQATPQTTISQTLVNTTTNPATVTYIVTPTSGVCVGNSFSVTVTVNPAINPNVVAINNTCFGVSTASITTSITGGILPYTITWTYPNGTTSNTTAISNLAPGVYDLLVNDMGNCPFTNSYIISEPNDIIITTDVNNNITCFGDANGAIAISVSGGTGAYIYTWTKNTILYASTEDISNLSPGTYVVSVTDANNCGPNTATFTITEPPILAVNLVSQTNVDCYGFATGEIAINVTGGTPIQISPGVFDYTYSWTGPNAYSSTFQNINNLIAGIYNLTVTDNLGCTKDLSITITQSSEIIISATTTLIECYGDDDATIAVTLSGGNPPYQFQWSNLASSLNQNNLSPGDYIITVTDNFNCQKALSINIPSPPIFTVNPVVTNVSCFGENDGSIILNFVGGIAPVTLVWSDGSTAGTTRNNLAPGTYSVTITDSKPCTIYRTFTIVEPLSLVLSANITNPLDCTITDSGAINLLVSGGVPPFTYLWSNGSSTEDLLNLVAGNYLVTVTDANGCTKTAQYSIIRPTPIVITVATQTDFNCQTHYVSQSFIAQVSGGIPPYQLMWSSGTISGANNEIMQTDINGTVLITATDSYGCVATYSLEVETPMLGYPSFETSSYGYLTYGLYAIGDPIQFESTITGDYVSVIWDFGDGTFSTDLNPVHTYLIPKDYIITQTVTYPFGCVYVQTISLLIEKGYVLVVPTAFTPNNDNLNDTFRPVTKALKNVRLDIYDTWGSLIFTETGEVLVGWDGKINGFNAENGNYYGKVRAETFYGTIVNENQTFVLIK